MSDRRYTVEEAEALLPDLRTRLPRIRGSRQEVLRHAERIRGKVVEDGGGVEGSAYFEAIRRLREDVEHLADLGIVLRDAETGLVDFPCEREGREVFLCWRLGEDRVGFWHDPEAGFAGRRPL